MMKPFISFLQNDVFMSNASNRKIIRISYRVFSLLRKPFVFWVSILVITGFALTTASPKLYGNLLSNDKILHFITFFYLTFICLSLRRNIIKSTQVVLLIFLYGLLIELLQYFIPSRQCSLSDILANSIGCLAGMIFYHSIRYMLIRYRKHTKPLGQTESCQRTTPIEETVNTY